MVRTGFTRNVSNLGEILGYLLLDNNKGASFWLSLIHWKGSNVSTNNHSPKVVSTLSKISNTRLYERSGWSIVPFSLIMVDGLIINLIRDNRFFFFSFAFTESILDLRLFCKKTSLKTGNKRNNLFSFVLSCQNNFILNKVPLFFYFEK